MPNKLIIRKAKPQDVKGIISLVKGSDQMYKKYLLRIKYEWLARRLAFIVHSKNLFNLLKNDFDDGFFVAVYNEEIIGYVEIIISVPSIIWRITSLHVSEKCRRKGMGAKLTDIAINYAQERGCKRVDVYATDDGIDFYNASGFQIVGKMHSLIYTLEDGAFE